MKSKYSFKVEYGGRVSCDATTFGALNKIVTKHRHYSDDEKQMVIAFENFYNSIINDIRSKNERK